MLHYCTYFDRNYLTRGVALYESLRRHSDPFVLWILCFDDEAHEALQALNLPSVRPIQLADFEREDTALLEAKADRARVEYYFTCTPSLPLYVLAQDPGIEAITYLDADLMFFANPRIVVDQLADASVGIVPHAFPKRLRAKEVYGVFNVGFVFFRNDASGTACLRDWRSNCLAWCYDRLEPGRFADQKYLDAWPGAYPSVQVLRDPGVTTAPWNLSDHRVAATGGTVVTDGERLIFYHYQGFRPLTSWAFDLGLGSYGPADQTVRSLIYRPYVQALRAAEAAVRRLLPEHDGGRGLARRSWPRVAARTIANLARGRLLFVRRERPS